LIDYLFIYPASDKTEGTVRRRYVLLLADRTNNKYQVNQLGSEHVQSSNSNSARRDRSQWNRGRTRQDNDRHKNCIKTREATRETVTIDGMCCYDSDK
jgi:hypothetical protein